MSISTNNKTLSNTPTSYQKLSSRLTPLVTNHNSIIRISAKGTSNSNSQISNSTTYSRITRQQLINQSLPSKVAINNPGSSVPKQSSATNSRLIRSEVATSTRNWEAECSVLKQTLDYYKNRINDLENKGHYHIKNSKMEKEKQESEAYKLKLEETEQRMNEENAYLRECLTKLNRQLDQTNQSIPILESNQHKLEIINKSLMQEIHGKQLEIRSLEQSYNMMIEQVKQQKSIGEDVGYKLLSFESNIKKLQEQNIKLHAKVNQINRIKLNLEIQLEQQKTKHKSMLKDCLQMQKQISSHKQHISELQQVVSKTREDNQDMRKMIDDDSKRSMLMSKSAYFNQSFQSDSTRLNNSCFTKHPFSSKGQKKMEMKKSYSTAIIQEAIQNDEFDINEYQQKAEEYRLMRMFIDIQRIKVPQNVCTLITLGEYFKDSTNVLYNEKLRLRSAIEKYKKLVEISWQNPNIEQHEKSQQFITDLIDKCNLYQSSLYQKKNTIDSLQDQLKFFKKQSKNSSKQPKARFKYLDREDQCEKQKIIKKLDNLNMKLTERRDERKITSTNTNISHGSVLDRLKSFRPVGFSSQKQQRTSHLKLKNISGEQIVKQMEKRLKFYEAEVVPELQAKISQYKGMIDTFEKQLSQSNVVQDNLLHSQVTLISSASNMNLNEDIRQRKRVNTASFSDFRASVMKQSLVTRPETSDSNISRQKKKRLDELTTEVSTKVLAAVTLRLCQIAQRMDKNQNYTIFLPSSIYLINYSDQYVGSLKIKILETPRQKMTEMRKYWAPQNIQGSPFGELSLVWNLGILLDQTIHGKLFFSSQDDIANIGKPYRFMQTNKPFFKRLIEKMLEKDENLRIRLKQIQTLILEEQQTLFN